MSINSVMDLKTHYNMLIGKLGEEYEWPLMAGKNIEVLDPVALSVARYPVAGASLGDEYVVFAGGAPILVGDTVDIFTFDKGLFYEEEL